MGHTLVISEKPAAAERIARALDEGNEPRVMKKGRLTYYECEREGNKLVVVYALGHLFELKQTEKGWTYPRLETEWVPRYEVDKKASDVKPVINLIKKLSREADSFIVATDYDIEGSLIGFLTLKYACNVDPHGAKRMRFSTLTRDDLVRAYEKMLPTLDFPMIESGYVRHQVDWLYGINLTRALTLAIKRASGWFKIVSTGRVQGPTLSFVAEREKEINLFIPTPYWTIDAVGEYNGNDLVFEYHKKRVDRLDEAQQIVNELKGARLNVSAVKATRSTVSPPVPFNLSGLQSEAYRHFGFKPSRTLALAQRLYLDALISYPRTSSQKIPPSIDTQSILEELKSQSQYERLIRVLEEQRRAEPVQGEKTDPAHPAIHPTGKKPERRLTPSERKLYDLIVRRFLAVFGEDSIRESMRVDLAHAGHTFHLRGRRVIKEGWMKLYGKYVRVEEQELPTLREGDVVPIERIEASEKMNQPPPRYNPASLLKQLERENLGTKATRAGIVDSLRSRGYTLSDRFELSTLGYATVETLERHVPQILSPEFTRRLEMDMEAIREGKRDREEVLFEAKRDLLQILDRFKEHEEEIGAELVEGLKRYWKTQEELGPCPKCGEGTLVIVRSPKTGKRFVGCSRYREGGCDLTFPLPQKGRIVPLDKHCEYCGYQMIRVVSGRRTWETCINWANCPGRQEDLKALQKRREKKE
ncbi:MAG: DNA topoisomerase I [Candidatus Thorarchaeota archaeon]